MKNRLLRGRIIAGLILILTVLCFIGGCGLDDKIIKDNNLDFEKYSDNISELEIRIEDDDKWILIKSPRFIKRTLEYLESIDYDITKSKKSENEDKSEMKILFQGKVICNLLIGEEEWIVNGKTVQIHDEELEYNQRFLSFVQIREKEIHKDLNLKLARGGISKIEKKDYKGEFSKIKNYEYIKLEKILNEMEFEEVESKTKKKDENVLEFNISYTGNRTINVKYRDGIWKFYGRSYKMNFKKDDPFTKEEVEKEINNLKKEGELKPIAEEPKEFFGKSQEVDNITIEYYYGGSCDFGHNARKIFGKSFDKKIVDKDKINDIMEIFKGNEFELLREDEEKKGKLIDTPDGASVSKSIHFNIVLKNNQMFKFKVSNNEIGIGNKVYDRPLGESFDDLISSIEKEAIIKQNHVNEISEYALKNMDYRKISVICFPDVSIDGMYQYYWNDYDEDEKDTEGYMKKFEKFFREMELKEVDFEEIKKDIIDKEQKCDSKMVFRFKNDMSFDTLVYDEILILNDRAYEVSDVEMLNLMKELYDEQYKKNLSKKMDGRLAALSFRYFIEGEIAQWKIGDRKEFEKFDSFDENYMKYIRFRHEEGLEVSKKDKIRVLIMFKGFEIYEIYFGEDSWIIDGVPVIIDDSYREENKELIKFLEFYIR